MSLSWGLRRSRNSREPADLRWRSPAGKRSFSISARQSRLRKKTRLRFSASDFFDALHSSLKKSANTITDLHSRIHLVAVGAEQELIDLHRRIVQVPSIN